MKKTVVITDTHFTDNPLDEYRFEFMDWFTNYCAENNINTVYFLGDLTEKKDNHSSILVNRIIEKIKSLAEVVEEIYILKGNHDYKNENEPFFLFLEQTSEKITFISEPFCSGEELFLPHTKDISRWDNIDISKYSRIYIHQCITGSKTGNGYELSGIPSDYFTKRTSAKIFGGDIHTPQTINGVEYIGTPYPIYFENEYKGNMVLIFDGKYEYIKVPSINRRSVSIQSPSDLSSFKFTPSDQIKIKLHITNSEAVNYIQYKADIIKFFEKVGANLCGIDLFITKEVPKESEKSVLRKENASPSLVVKRFSEIEKLDEKTIAAAFSIVGEE